MDDRPALSNRRSELSEKIADLRWNNGVLEQAEIISIDESGIVVSTEKIWRPVPHVVGDGADGPNRSVVFLRKNATVPGTLDDVSEEVRALVLAARKSRHWVEANTVHVRGLSAQAAAPGELMLKEIDAALKAFDKVK